MQDLKVWHKQEQYQELAQSSKNIPWLSNLSENEMKDTCDSIDKSIST